MEIAAEVGFTVNAKQFTRVMDLVNEQNGSVDGRAVPPIPGGPVTKIEFAQLHYYLRVGIFTLGHGPKYLRLNPDGSDVPWPG